jgi:hypothetical protein
VKEHFKLWHEEEDVQRTDDKFAPQDTTGKAPYSNPKKPI